MDQVRQTENRTFGGEQCNFDFWDWFFAESLCLATLTGQARYGRQEGLVLSLSIVLISLLTNSNSQEQA